MHALPTILPAHPEAPEPSERVRKGATRVLFGASRKRGARLAYTMGFTSSPHATWTGQERS